MFGFLREPRWRIPSLLLLFTLFFYWKILFTNRVMFPWDAGDFFYPFLSFVHEELRHLRLPLWNPYSMSGFPIIGDPEAQIFYPPNWLLVLLDPFWHLPYKLVEAHEIAHFFLAGLFMYWLAKEFTHDTVAALLGGVLFMSSGAMVAHTEHVASVEAMAWYPLVLLLARRGLLQKEYFWTILAGLFFGVETLTGHWQHAVYLGLLLFLYFAYEACFGPLRGRLWPHWIVQLLLIGAIGAGLAMIQILPTSELGPLSIRTYVTYWDVTGGNAPRYLWTLFLPNYFGGLNGVPYLENVEPSFNYVFLTVPGCLLAVVGLIEMARRRNFFWLVLIALAFELSFGRHGYLAGLIYRTPVLNLFRQMPVYFDLGNLGLCLMAAVGAHALFDKETRGFYLRWLPVALGCLFAGAAGLALVHSEVLKIPGWYHMLAVLALFSLLITAWLGNRLPKPVVQGAVLLLVAFELCFYSMNQKFNWEINNPRTVLSYDFAARRKETLTFLRRDAGGDFRVAAFDGSPWGSNGSNVWRIPAIFGWNPILLRSYREYVRQFIQLGNYAQPYSGPDHRLDSPLLDLLGVKYLLAIGPVEQEQRLAESRKFEKVFAEPDWRAIYHNPDYLSRAWFYPQAYMLPDRATTLALMNSGWFQARRTLLYAQPDLPTGAVPHSEPLAAITLLPDQVSASAAGAARTDQNCAESRRFFGDWGGRGMWVRFDGVSLPEPGRYTLLAEYADPYSVPPKIEAEVAQGESKMSGGAVVLPRTNEWNCTETRIAELGEFDLSPGNIQITLTSKQDSPLNLFSLWLVRLPYDWTPQGTEDAIHPAPPREDNFSFRDFNVSANRIAFRAELSQDGFVFLNEIYYPGWEATVDGQPAEILRADYIFRALAVSRGSHQIEMRFRPRFFWLGASVSVLTLAALLAYFVIRRRRKTA